VLLDTETQAAQVKPDDKRHKEAVAPERLQMWLKILFIYRLPDHFFYIRRNRRKDAMLDMMAARRIQVIRHIKGLAHSL
jgi:hypothetical protein